MFMYGGVFCSIGVEWWACSLSCCDGTRVKVEAFCLHSVFCVPGLPFIHASPLENGNNWWNVAT